VVNKTGNRIRILERCKFWFWYRFHQFSNGYVRNFHKIMHATQEWDGSMPTDKLQVYTQFQRCANSDFNSFYDSEGLVNRGSQIDLSLSLWKTRVR